MKRLIEFPFKVDIYKFGIIKKQSSIRNSVKTIAGRGGISLSEKHNGLYFNFGFSNVIKNKGHYFNITVSKYYLQQMVLDCLLFRPIETYKPKKYVYNDNKFRSIMKGMMPIENLHTVGVKAYLERTLERIDNADIFHLTQKQRLVMNTQREQLIKRILVADFIKPGLVGNSLLEAEGSW